MQKFLNLDVKKFTFTPTDNKQFIACKFYAIAEGLNRNNSSFTEQSLYDAIPTTYNKPILAHWDNDDFTEHISDLDFDKTTGELFYNYLNGERPIGIINESSDVQVEDYLGNKWLTFTGLIWVEYHKQAVDLLKKRRSNKVSVEISVNKSYIDDNGVEIIEEFELLGVTLLGAKISEGIKNAHLDLIELNQSEQFLKYRTALSFAYQNKEVSKRVFHNLSMNQLRNRIDAILSEFKVDDGEWTYQKYWIDDITNEFVIVNDNEDGKLYRIHYEVNENNDVVLDMNSKEEVEIDYKPTSFAQKIEVFLEKDKWGTGEKLNIDKSKEKMSDSPWGSVNKTELRNKILEASNYKTLVKSVYLLVEAGWEDSPSSKLKYPVMEIKDNTLVYNKNGIKAAEGYATKNNETEVLNKIKSLKKKLGLDENTKKEEPKKMNKNFKADGYIFLGNNDKYALFIKKGTAKVYAHPLPEDENADFSMKEEELKEMSVKAEFSDGQEMEMDEVMCKYAEEVEKDKEEMSAEKAQLSAEKEELAKDKEALNVEKEEMAKKLQEAEEELKKEKMSKFIQDVEDLLDNGEDELDEEFKADIRAKMSEGKFTDIEDVKKEIAYAKYKKEEEIRMAKKNEYKVNLNNPKFKPEKSLYDDIKDSVKNLK